MYCISYTRASGVPLASGAVSYSQSIKSANYTLTLADAGYQILHPASDTTTRIWTIPSNASVAFPIGTTILLLVQQGAGTVRLNITTDTLRSADGLTGSRILVANIQYQLIKISSTEWNISGGEGVALSQYVAIGHDTSPFVTAYTIGSSAFGSKFTNPTTLPTATVKDLAFNPARSTLVLAHSGGSPTAASYPWSSTSGFGVRHTDPSPAVSVPISVAIDPSGTSVAFSNQNADTVVAYAYSSSGFGGKYTNPATLAGDASGRVAFSPAGTEVAVTSAASPYINAYTFSSGFGSKFTNPVTLPTGIGRGVAFSPAGTELVVGHDSSPFVTAYAWSVSGFGSKFTNPVTLPTGSGRDVAFNPTGTAVAIAHDSSPYVTVYAWSASGFGSKFTNPVTLPTGIGTGVVFSSDGTEIAVSHNTSPFCTIYPWSVSGFGTKFTNPTTLPTGDGYAVDMA